MVFFGVRYIEATIHPVVIGGSALSQGLCKAGLENGINLYTAYGMSETCPLLTVANLKPHMLAWDAARQVEMRCRTGLPVPNVLLEVVDTEGNDVTNLMKALEKVNTVFMIRIVLLSIAAAASQRCSLRS